ncbi:hypothetical protein [Sphingobacterium endophyticum]|uniref:hypothetical protein n=1 Tax=Sphingobacterium endophyticum TaxID=2546448 RepID=UPI0012E115AE|nr:hypothetical protein [Sphingobacterium endophyticum]
MKVAIMLICIASFSFICCSYSGNSNNATIEYDDSVKLQIPVFEKNSVIDSLFSVIKNEYGYMTLNDNKSIIIVYIDGKNTIEEISAALISKECINFHLSIFEKNEIGLLYYDGFDVLVVDKNRILKTVDTSHILLIPVQMKELPWFYEPILYSFEIDKTGRLLFMGESWLYR